MKDMWLRVLGWMLNQANANVRDGFYVLKAKVLSRYGTHAGDVIQHIKKMCHACDGTGIWTDHGYREGRPCYRCQAGVYSEFWVLLERWSMGGYSFLNPIDRRRADEKAYLHPELSGRWHVAYQMEIINGKITHESSGRLGDECFYWLALMFDRTLFRKSFGNIGHYGRTKYPLVTVASWVYRVKEWWRFWHLWEKCPGCEQAITICGRWEFGKHREDCWLNSNSLPF